MLTFIRVIVFQLPRELLFDFVGAVVADFILEHQGSWNQNKAFIDGINSNFEENTISDPTIETQSLNSFIDSLHHYLESIESDQSISEAITTPSNFKKLIPLEYSTPKSKLVQEILPTSSMSSQRDKRIKREPKAKEFRSCKRSRKQSDEMKLKASSLASQDHEWRTVEGWGPFVFAYQPCGL